MRGARCGDDGLGAVPARRRERVRARGDGVVYELLQIITPMKFHGFDPANGGLLGQSDLGTYGSVTAGG